MSIVRKQNLPNQIEMLAAQRNLYSCSKRIIGLQMILGGPVAVCATFLSMTYPEIRGYIALWGVVILFLDLAILTPWQKKLRENGAKVQELFDCTVLDISWNEIKAGKKPEPELIHEQAKKYGVNAKNLAELNNWYPVSVQDVPILWGTIICQRANVWWDAKLRRKFATSIFFALIVISLLLISYGVYIQINMLDFITYIAAPISAAYVLGCRQFAEHRDSADRLDKLRDHADKFWMEAINGESISRMKPKSRLLQDEIFDGRKKNPPIFDFIFRIFRDENETLMNRAANVLIEEAKKVNIYKNNCG